jgi:UDP-N-acetylglucosamine 2-epimerase (non-hydrolysing)
MAMLCKEFDTRQMPYKLCVTAQHREMLDQVMQFFQLTPDYDLDLMQPNQSLNVLGSKILNAMDAILAREHFNLVLVHGDTLTSTMVALAAFHREVRVGHVEAGLRTYNKKSPFPEELNRQLTGRIADYHFAPTRAAQENLLREGVYENSILVTGNTVIDALNWTLQTIKKTADFPAITAVEKNLNQSKKLIMVTGHRRENLGNGLADICNAILQITQQHDVEVVFALHMNPNAKGMIVEILGDKANIHLIPAIEYPVFVWLMNKASLIISDSGGIQEEAPSLNVPVIVTRDTTERQEGVDKGYAYLVGTNTLKIVDTVSQLLKSSEDRPVFKNPYGDGNASKKIADFIENLSL